MRQIYALARELLDRARLPWPATRTEASALIERLRGEAAGTGRTEPRAGKG